MLASANQITQNIELDPSVPLHHEDAVSVGRPSYSSRIMTRHCLQTKRLASSLLAISAISLVCLLHDAALLNESDPSTHPNDMTRTSFMAAPSRGSNDYVQDDICSGCRHGLVLNEKDGLPFTRCGLLIQQRHDQSFMPLQQAAQAVADEYPNHCGQCAVCDPEKKRYWRYDRVIPRSSIHSATTFTLPSVPSDHRIPASAMRNLTAYFLNDLHSYPNKEHLFDYNPSIVVLPDDQVPAWAPSAVYLASVRVSNRHFCFYPSDRKLMMRGHSTKAQDWLGLVLLDKDLAMLHDTVLDLSKSGFATGGVEDYRLFVLPTSSGRQLYIATNDMIAPFWLQNPPADIMLVPRVFDSDSPAEQYLQMFLRPFVSCAPCSKTRGLCGKNFNYFTNAAGAVLVELWPSPPHTSRPVNLNEPCQRQLEPTEHIVDERRNIVSSFGTVEEVYFPQLSPQQFLLTRGRGSACCIDMEHPKTGQPLLVGIMHSKTPSQNKHRLPVSSTNVSIIDNHYLSRLYAFEPTAPYRIITLSGLFCLGFPTEQEQAHVPLARATLWRNLVLGQEFNCPRIHFISGMTIAANDLGSVIIAYGVNDCVSRMIRVSIKDLQQLLFYGKQI